jgi:hypothetical protein
MGSGVSFAGRVEPAEDLRVLSDLRSEGSTAFHPVRTERPSRSSKSRPPTRDIARIVQRPQLNPAGRMGTPKPLAGFRRFACR